MKQITKAQRVLEFIRDSGGATTGEVQRFVVEQLNGKNYDERDPVGYHDEILGRFVKVKDGPRKWRGYWAGQFYGEYNGHSGLFANFCKRGEDGKWRVVREIKGPFYPRS